MCAPFMLSIGVLQNNRLVVDFFRGLPAPSCFRKTSKDFDSKASRSRPRHHPPQPHPITFKPLLSPSRAAVNAVVLVAMHRHARAHAAGQFVQLMESVFVVAGRFVGDEDVGLQRGQLFDFVGVDAGPVLEVFTASREDAWRLMLEADEWATGPSRPGPLLDS